MTTQTKISLMKEVLHTNGNPQTIIYIGACRYLKSWIGRTSSHGNADKHSLKRELFHTNGNPQCSTSAPANTFGTLEYFVTSGKHVHVMYTLFTPLLYRNTEVCMGIPFSFLIFAPKHRLWVLVRTASPF